MNRTRRKHRSAVIAARRRLALTTFTIAFTVLGGAARRSRADIPSISTEDFLNRLGVNTHLNGLTRDDPWNTNVEQVASQLRYIGVRLVRDWAWSVEDGARWRSVQKAWRPDGRFWTSIDEGSPQNQRRSLGFIQQIWKTYPGLICAMGGPNEEDDEYPQSQGATLPDSALVQRSLYDWAHSGGRNVPVSQMEFGAGWKPENQWQGDYNPKNTGIGQNYTPGPADIAAAHTYLSDPHQRPGDVLNMLRKLALLTTPGKPVAHTEVGAYTSAGLTPEQYGQYIVTGALDCAAAGDVGYLVYGLQDSGPERTYGFYTYPEGKANPAAEYFHTMTMLLAATRGGYGPGAKPTFTARPLGASFASESVSHLVMQKPTGEYVVAAWSEQVASAPEHAIEDTIQFGHRFGLVRVYDIEKGSVPIAELVRTTEAHLRLAPNHTYFVICSDAHSESGRTAAGPE